MLLSLFTPFPVLLKDAFYKMKDEEIRAAPEQTDYCSYGNNQAQKK
jgi:hypothetical protein